MPGKESRQFFLRRIVLHYFSVLTLCDPRETLFVSKDTIPYKK